MKKVAIHGFAKNGRPIQIDWDNHHGVVYLFRCAKTGAYKLGGTINPLPRFYSIVNNEKSKYGLYPYYVWSIITNGVGRLEACWHNEWRQFRAFDKEFEKRFEWFRPPESEVSRFRSFSMVNWKNRRAVPIALMESLSPPAPTHRVCKIPCGFPGRQR